MFVIVLSDVVAFGPYPSRAEAESAIRDQFPAKPVSILALMPGLNASTAIARNTDPVSQVKAPLPEIPGLDRMLPGQFLSPEETLAVRDVVETVLAGAPRLYGSFRVAVGGSTAKNVRGGFYTRMQASTARKILQWLQKAGASEPARISPANPETPSTESGGTPHPIARADLGACLLDVAISRGISRRPEAIAESAGVSVKTIEQVISGSEPSAEDQTLLLSWLTR